MLCEDGDEGSSLACLQLADFVVDEATIPEALPEVPTETGEAIEESEFKKWQAQKQTMARKSSRGSEI